MLKWVNSLDIAIALDEKYPDTDPQYVRFTAVSYTHLTLPTKA